MAIQEIFAEYQHNLNEMLDRHTNVTFDDSDNMQISSLSNIIDYISNNQHPIISRWLQQSFDDEHYITINNTKVGHIHLAGVTINEDVLNLLVAFNKLADEAKSITFDNCTFNLQTLYIDDRADYNIYFNNCTFNSLIWNIVDWNLINKIFSKNCKFAGTENINITINTDIKNINIKSIKNISNSPINNLFKSANKLHITKPSYGGGDVKIKTKQNTKLLDCITVKAGTTIEFNFCNNLLFENISLLNLSLSYSTNVSSIKFKGSNNSIDTCSKARGEIHIDYPLYFENVTFNKITLPDVRFNILKFNGCTFNTAPNFLNSEFYTNSSFDNCKFKDKISEDCDVLYRHLRIQMNNIEAGHYASIFQALEFEARHNLVLSKHKIFHKTYGLEKLSSLFLSYTTNYSQNLTRPLCILFVGFIAFWALYYSTGTIVCSTKASESYWLFGSCTSDPILAFIYSAADTFGPLGILIKDGLSPKTPLIKALSLFHALFSSLLWFLFITSLRKRFKISG